MPDDAPGEFARLLREAVGDVAPLDLDDAIACISDYEHDDGHALLWWRVTNEQFGERVARENVSLLTMRVRDWIGIRGALEAARTARETEESR